MQQMMFTFNLNFLLFFCFICVKSFARQNDFESEQRDITDLYRHNLRPMIAKMNDNIEPCDNFFEHVCGGYSKPRPRIRIYWAGNEQENDEDDNEAAENGVPPFLYNKEDQMHFFEQNCSNFTTRPGEILCDLYNDCKQRNHYDVINGAMPPRWTRMLYEIEFLARKSYVYRQFPFLKFQWQRLSGRHELNWISLAARFAAHGIQTLLQIFFAEQTIYLAPAVEMNACMTPAQIEASLLPLLGRRNPQIAAIIGTELWAFCQLLASEAELEPNFVTQNNTEPLQEEYFEAFFVALNLSEQEVENARHIQIDLTRLERLFTVLQNTEPRIIFNYVLWRVYMELAYEDCFRLTEEFEQLLFSEYWHWHVFKPYFSRDAIMATYLFQTTRFQRHRKQILMSADWDKFLYKKLFQKDFNIERMIRNYSHTFLITDTVLAVYGVAALEERYFYGNLLSLRRLKLRDSFYQPLVDDEDLNHPSYFLRQFLYFAILLLKQPLFHYFASQGLQFWQHSNILYSSDGYYTALDCLERQSLSQLYDEDHIEMGPSIYRILPAVEIKDIFNFHAAFFESLRDYRFWLSSESFAFAEDFVLEYFQLDSKRVLFYAAAQLYCDRSDALYSTLINRSFMNLPEFAVAFNCSADAPMNPAAKCMLRNCDQ